MNQALDETINRWAKIARCTTAKEIRDAIDNTVCALCQSVKDCTACVLYNTDICSNKYNDLVSLQSPEGDEMAVAISSMILEQLMIIADGGVNK